VLHRRHVGSEPDRVQKAPGDVPFFWYFDGMRTAIDAAGRVIVPKSLRDQLGLAPGRELEIQARDGALVIEPVPTQVALVRRGKRFVAKPKTALPKLTQAEVRAALEGSRR
jgi:AbrB family looped-hinge helix DNA binding protein